MEDTVNNDLVGGDISPVISTEITSPQGTTIPMGSPQTAEPTSGPQNQRSGPRTRGQALRAHRSIIGSGEALRFHNPMLFPPPRLPRILDSDDNAPTGDERRSVWTGDIAAFVLSDDRKFTLTADEYQSTEHLKSRTFFLASYATLKALKPVLQQASQNMMHNMLTAGVLPPTPYSPEHYFCPFEVMENLCYQIISHETYGAISPFKKDYSYVARLPDRLDVVDPRLLHQMMWITSNRASQTPVAMATLPPLTQFAGLDNRNILEFRKTHYENPWLRLAEAPTPLGPTPSPANIDASNNSFAGLADLPVPTNLSSTVGFRNISSSSSTPVAAGGIYLNANDLPSLTAIDSDALDLFVTKLANYYAQTGSMKDIRTLIANPTHATTLISLLVMSSLLPEGQQAEDEFFRNFQTFKKVVEKYVSQQKPSNRSSQGIINMVKDKLNFNILNPLDHECLMKITTQYHSYCLEYKDVLDNMSSQAELLAQFIKVNSAASKPLYQRNLFGEMLSESKRTPGANLSFGFTFLRSFIAKTKVYLEFARDVAGWSPPESGSTKRRAEHITAVAEKGFKKPKTVIKTPNQPSGKPPTAATPREKCTVCGDPKHYANICKRRSAKFANLDPKVEWLTSPTGGIAMRKAYPGLTERVAKYLPDVTYLEKLKAVGTITSFNPKDFEGTDPDSVTVGTCACFTTLSTTVPHSYPHTCNCSLPQADQLCGASTPSHAHYISSIVDAILTIYTPLPHSTQCRVLIDTGALQASYASTAIGDWLRDHHLPSSTDTNLVCSPINNTCTSSSSMYSVSNIVVFDRKVKSAELSIDFKILSMTSSLYDIIIGLPDITKYNLLFTFTHRFESDIVSAVGPDSAAPIRENGPSPAAKHSLASENDNLLNDDYQSEYDNSHWLQLFEESKAREDSYYLANMTLTGTTCFTTITKLISPTTLTGHR